MAPTKMLGAFFDAETILIMKASLEEAWEMLGVVEQRNTDKSTLAARILRAAAACAPAHCCTSPRRRSPRASGLSTDRGKRAAAFMLARLATAASCALRALISEMIDP
jgi:hypothetical protein